MKTNQSTFIPLETANDESDIQVEKPRKEQLLERKQMKRIEIKPIQIEKKNLRVKKLRRNKETSVVAKERTRGEDVIKFLVLLAVCVAKRSKHFLQVEKCSAE